VVDSVSAAPVGQDSIHLAPHGCARFAPLHSAHQQIHHRPKLARRLGPARERGVATTEEDEVVQFGAGEAERSWPLHDEQLPGALALARQVQSLSGEMTTSSFMSGGDDKRDQWPKT